jgi:CubicO group peptidase (beta-lactamase class C family)
MKESRGVERFLAVLAVWILPVVVTTPARGAVFQASFDSYVHDDGVVGASYVVLNRGKIAEAHTIGMADLEERQPVDGNTIFHWASITKTLTAVAIMQLRDRGKLSLDDPIIKYVPELRRVHSEDDWPARVTLRHLLSRSAGFQTRTWPYGEDSKPGSPSSPPNGRSSSP